MIAWVRHRLAVAATLAILSGIAGCVTPQPLPEVGRDAPLQYVVRASQYAFTTDFPLPRTDPLITELTDLRETERKTLKLSESNDLVRIVIFENRQRYDEFLRVNYPELPSRRAFFVKQGTDGSAVFACRGEHLRHDLRHEVTHALLHSSLPRVPLWIDEGLAEYFEASGSPADAIFSLRHVERLEQDARQSAAPDLRRLETLHDLGQMTAAHYRESWLWVHFCLEGPLPAREAFHEHWLALKRGEPDSLAERLARHVGDPSVQVAAHRGNLARQLAIMKPNGLSPGIVPVSATIPQP